jgi:hypothetical protein
MKGDNMKTLIIILILSLVLLSISCAITPEQKMRQERIEIYKLYLNYGIIHKSLTPEEIEQLDKLKDQYRAFDKVIWE